MTSADVRDYTVRARSTDTFGRVLASSRDHHFVIDGPVHNGCPGEAITPTELFLGGVAGCAVELLEVIARERGYELSTVGVSVRAVIDRANPVRADVTVFNAVHISFDIGGAGDEEAAALVEAFTRR